MQATCTADRVGFYGCTCADCLATQAADIESEVLNELGANYAYSGFSYSDAMQLAREEMRARVLRSQLPEIRRSFIALRGQWWDHKATTHAGDLWEQCYALYLDGCAAGGRDFCSNVEARRSFAADMTAWARKQV